MARGLLRLPIFLGLALAVLRCGSAQDAVCSNGPGEASSSLLQSAQRKRKTVLLDDVEPSQEPQRQPSGQQPQRQQPASGVLPQAKPEAAAALTPHRPLDPPKEAGPRRFERARLLLRQWAVRLRSRAPPPPAVLLLGVLAVLAAVALAVFLLNRSSEKRPESPWKQLVQPPGARRGQGGSPTAAAPKAGRAEPNPMVVSTPRPNGCLATEPASLLSLAPGATAPSGVAVPLEGHLDAAESANAFLCPGLVVPEECECSLLVPRLKPRQTLGEITVDDAARVPVFRVQYCLPDGAVSAQHLRASLEQETGRCLVISSSADDHTVFAFCRLGFNGALTILDAAEKPFGLIRSRVGKAGFEVATRLGSQIHVGLNTAGDLAAIDRRGRTLALTQQVPNDGQHRMLRIGPFVDAGLVTLAVLAVDLLEGAPAA